MEQAVRGIKVFSRLVFLFAFLIVTPFVHVVNAKGTNASTAEEQQSTNRRSGWSIRFPEDLVAAAGPIIDVWYGSDQSFGQHGWPQDRINIVGTVSDPSGKAVTLQYSLNGSDPQNVSLGGVSSNPRLVKPGDFNIELFDPRYGSFIDYTPPFFLKDGINTLVLTASNGTDTTTRTVSIQYTLRGAEASYPLYSVTWQEGLPPNSLAQVVDGKWALTASGARTVETGYDRVIAVGDLRWDNYDVTVPVKIHSPAPADAGLGLLLGWQGHYQVGSESPLQGWDRIGAYGYYSWRLGGKLTMRIDGFESPIDKRVAMPFDVGVQYIMRMQVERGSQPSIATYRIKMWPAGQVEPSAWGVEMTDTAEIQPSGSVLLVAHKVDATFDNVMVRPINESACLTLDIPFNPYGLVTASPIQACYTPGTMVTLTAEPKQGYVFNGWSGELAGFGSQNPLTLQVDGSKKVEASFITWTERSRIRLPMIQR